jgi:hypothetical protein
MFSSFSHPLASRILLDKYSGYPFFEDRPGALDAQPRPSDRISVKENLEKFSIILSFRKNNQSVCRLNTFNKE